MTKSAAVDCIVVGAGPAGSATAMRLCALGRRVALVDGGGSPAVGDHLCGRAGRILAALGAWPVFLATNPLPSRGVRCIWERADARDSVGITWPMGAGWHVERKCFDAALRKCAREAGADLVSGRVVDVKGAPGDWQVVVPGQTLSSRWIVDATGRRCHLARLLGGRPVVVDRLYGRVKSWRADIPAFGMVEAVDHGWWYSAALPNHRAISIYFTDPGVVRDDGWLGSATAVRLRDAVFEGETKAYAGSQWCEPGAGWLPVGDAALGRDPLSSAGLLGALASAYSAGDALHAALDGGEPTSYTRALLTERAAYLSSRSEVYGEAARRFRSSFWQARVGSPVGSSPRSSAPAAEAVSSSPLA